MKQKITPHLMVFGMAMAIGTFTNAQNVGINTTGDPGHPSAMLDLDAADKGLLIPRVALTDVGSASPVAAPAEGLLVFNTNATVSAGVGTGFYYWSGSAWTKLSTGNSLSASLTDGKLWIGNAAGVPTEQTLAGDAVLNNAGTLDLTDLAVETSEIDNLAVTNAKLADDAVSTAKLANDAVTGSKINLAANAAGDLMYYDGTDWVRLASGTSGQVLRSNGTAAPAWADGNTILRSENGLTGSAPDTVRLGGALTQHTVIEQGTYRFAFTGTDSNAFSVDSTTFAVDAANNRVGIGIDVPSATLHVIHTDTTNNRGLLIQNPTGAGKEARLSFAAYGGYTPGTTYPGAQISAKDDGNWGAHLLFYTKPNGADTNALKERMRITNNGRVAIGASAPEVPLAVGGNGTNVYGTTIWAENNIHVQGNEPLEQGGRGRLRVGTVNSYVGLVAERSSTDSPNDLALFASSGLVRVGAPGNGQNLRISGLQGTGNRLATVNNDGQLGSGVQMLYARVNHDGTLDNCHNCGITVQREGTGIYTVTFGTSFSNAPAVTATIHRPNSGNDTFADVTIDGSNATFDRIVTFSVEPHLVRIKTGDTNGNTADRSFNIVAVGPR